MKPMSDLALEPKRRGTLGPVVLNTSLQFTPVITGVAKSTRTEFIYLFLDISFKLFWRCKCVGVKCLEFNRIAEITGKVEGLLQSQTCL